MTPIKSSSPFPDPPTLPNPDPITPGVAVRLSAGRSARRGVSHRRRGVNQEV
jgi:hypothetical protein